mgnify:CR=1 FL=1
MQVTNAHIVAIRRNGVVEGHQLRVNSGGPGCTKFFSASKFGSAEKARAAAVKFAKANGLPKTKPRGGSPVGRVLKTSLTGAAGIRFTWTRTTDKPILRVNATWVDKKGRSRHTSFSVDRNGLEGALDKAIEARVSAGAPAPDRADLVKRLKKFKKAGPDAAK